MPDTAREYQALQHDDPWEDSDWIPSDAEILLPRDELSELLLETPVSALAIDSPVYIAADADMRQAIMRTRQRHVRALLVMDGFELVGIVTERDAVMHIGPGQTGAGVLVSEIMTSQPATVHPDDPVGKAAQQILVEGAHHIPVVDEGEVVGIIATGRLLHSIIPVLVGD